MRRGGGRATRLSAVAAVTVCCFCRTRAPLPVSQLHSSTTTLSNVINSLGRPAPSKAHVSSKNCTRFKNEQHMFTTLVLVAITCYPLRFGSTIFWVSSRVKAKQSQLPLCMYCMQCGWLSPLLLQAVNELLDSLGAPLEIVDGFVSSIAVTIPWQALLTDHCTLEVSGLQITCRPKYRTSECSEKLLLLVNYSVLCFRCFASIRVYL